MEVGALVLLSFYRKSLPRNLGLLTRTVAPSGHSRGLLGVLFPEVHHQFLGFLHVQVETVVLAPGAQAAHLAPVDGLVVVDEIHWSCHPLT